MCPYTLHFLPTPTLHALLLQATNTPRLTPALQPLLSLTSLHLSFPHNLYPSRKFHWLKQVLKPASLDAALFTEIESQYRALTKFNQSPTHRHPTIASFLTLPCTPYATRQRMRCKHLEAGSGAAKSSIVDQLGMKTLSHPIHQPKPSPMSQHTSIHSHKERFCLAEALGV